MKAVKAVKALKTRFAEVYKKNDKGILKPNIPYLSSSKDQSGVYLIKKQSTGDIVYIGVSSSGRLYRTFYHHFHKWNEREGERERILYPKTGYSARIIFTTPAQAVLLEKYLIINANPKDNAIKYKEYLKPAQTKAAEDIEESTITFKGKEEDFPF